MASFTPITPPMLTGAQASPFGGVNTQAIAGSVANLMQGFAKAKTATVAANYAAPMAAQALQQQKYLTLQNSFLPANQKQILLQNIAKAHTNLAQAGAAQQLYNSQAAAATYNAANNQAIASTNQTIAKNQQQIINVKNLAQLAPAYATVASHLTGAAATAPTTQAGLRAYKKTAQQVIGNTNVGPVSVVGGLESNPKQGANIGPPPQAALNYVKQIGMTDVKVHGGFIYGKVKGVRKKFKY